jgi:hypothetical protein
VGDEPRAPGWYPDPWGGEGERWFDGTSWSRDRVDDLPAPGHDPRRRRRRGLGAVVAILLAAAAVGAVFVFAGGGEGTSDEAGSATTTAREASTTTTVPSLVLGDYERGDCATWDQAQDEAPAHLVDCDDAHLIELVAPRKVGDDFTHFPTEAEWDYLDATLCGPVVERYLGTRIDPQGMYAAGGIMPTEASWDDGLRQIECGVIHAGTSRLPRLMVPFDGAVDGTRQYEAKPPGTCLPLVGDQIGEPVPCDQPHALEVVGAVDLSGRIDHAPDDDELETLLGDECRRQAIAYVGHPLDGDLRDGWVSLLPGAWDGGHRVLECTVGRYPGAATGPATVTGSLRPSA